MNDVTRTANDKILAKQDRRRLWDAEKKIAGLESKENEYSIFDTLLPALNRNTGGNDHPFRFKKTSLTGGTLTLGAVYLAGTAKTITSWPTNGILAGVTTTTHYWIAIDLSAGTTTWGSGASLPANTATVEYWEILVLTCAASVITGIKECQTSDIHIAPGA